MGELWIWFGHGAGTGNWFQISECPWSRKLAVKSISRLMLGANKAIISSHVQTLSVMHF